ncbi:hypothetical protein F5878DRAFT_553961 [Lentinula raphanica]|uniref:Fe2OG dioxygenase domain-containing protein n=1 Tax=Lentinula raphanica TaxID=153919 RepID=A0AA38PII1_9AGAR|nr:hypothetical protein F5880DRAFT_1172301 [Lentinula raphanica]KAJ3843529.1 hypothetical protein F5878DRAFT_553961 [Lentinula raphanica]
MAPKGKKALATSSTTQAHEQHPDWPPFKLILPQYSLSIQEIVPNQIVTIPNFWPSSLCKTYISFLSSLPLVTTPGKPKKGDAVRVNDRFQIQDALFAKRLWEETGLKDVVMGDLQSDEGLQLDGETRRRLWGGEVVGLSPNIRIYRYSKGQFFDQHYDDSNNVTVALGQTEIPARTTWTLLLYLTSQLTGCVGGETVFYPDPPTKKAAPPEPIVVELEVGMALLHRHGAECMLHEGREVLAGEKWVIRSDLCVRR